MDILLSLQSVQLDQKEKITEPSSEIRQRVLSARERQYQRYQREVTNAKVPFEILNEISPLTTDQKKMLTIIVAKQNRSNRVQIKIIRLARTISDLAGETAITDNSLWEAFSLRRLSVQKQKSVVREI